jgi:hypothetical protein
VTARRLSRDDEATIRTRAAAGESNRSIARDFGVSHVTIGKVVATAAPVPPPAAPPTPTATDAEPFDSSASALEVCRRLLADAVADTSSADRTVAQRSRRDAAGLAILLARLEKSERADEDVLHVSRADIEEAMASVMEKSRALCEKPLLCAECGRQIAVLMAEGRLAP